MSRRQQLIGSIVVVLALLAGASAVAGVAVGQTAQGDRVYRTALDSIVTQQNDSDAGEAARYLETIRTTIDDRVVTRNTTVNVTTVVSNERMEAVTDSLTVRVDGKAVTTRRVTVSANATSSVVFTTDFAEIGVHNVSVGNSSAMVGVTRPASAFPDSNQSAAGRLSRTVTPGPNAAGAPNLFTVLLGVGATAVVLVAVVTVLAVRRFR